MKKSFLLIIAIILSGCADTKENNSPKNQDTIGNSKISELKYKPDYDHQVHVNRLNATLATIANRQTISEYLPLDEVKFFSDANSLISESKNDTNKDVQKLAEQLRKKMIPLQTSEFPNLRKEYIKESAQKVWEFDMKIKGSGAGNTTIIFIAGEFAANKNKADFQASIENVLTTLRFKKSIYEWYEGADEYTQYTIQSPKDSELIH